MNEKLEELEKIRAHITALQDECDKMYNDYMDNTPELKEIKDEVFDYVFNNTLYVYRKIKDTLSEEEH